MGALTVADLVPGDAEPRIKDLVLAERLGMADIHDIRRLIERNAAEMREYGPLFSGTVPEKRRGRPSRHYLLNEGQALAICMLARTPKAASVRAQVIKVFMAYRHGLLVPAGGFAPGQCKTPQAGAENKLPSNLTENQIAEARSRIEILGRVDELLGLGIRISRAVKRVAEEAGLADATIWNWRARLRDQPEAEALVALAPRWNTTGARPVEIDREIWAIFRRCHMTAVPPVFARSYLQARAAAEALGVSIPHRKTFERRFQAEALRALRASITQEESKPE